MDKFDHYECDKYEECMSHGRAILCSDMYICKRWRDFMPYRECLNCNREYDEDYPECILQCDDDRAENFAYQEGYYPSDDTDLEDY